MSKTEQKELATPEQLTEMLQTIEEIKALLVRAVALYEDASGEQVPA